MDPQSFIYLGSHSNNNISAEELRDLSQAMSSLKSERSLQEEKESLRDLKEDREEYVEVSVRGRRKRRGKGRRGGEGRKRRGWREG